MFSGSIAKTITLLCMSTVVTSTVLLQNGFQAENEIRLPGIDNLKDSSAPEGRTASPLRWFGQASAQGPNITIVGRDAKQILDQLRIMNPEYDSFRKQADDAQPKALIARNAAMQKRQESHTLCSIERFAFVHRVDAVNEGIDYLDHVGGFCIVDGPKDSCNRCSCSWETGIWMCNDSNRGETHQYMYCSDMAQRVRDIYNQCNCETRRATCNGQWFRHDTEYSVLVAGTGRDYC